jgi:hypothetical protein
MRRPALESGPVAYAGEDIYCDEILSGRLPVRVAAETDRVLNPRDAAARSRVIVAAAVRR